MLKNSKIRLGLNIDHVATIRNARGGTFPDPVLAAKMAQEFGVDGITAHLREDRRHIKDNDIFCLKKEVDLPLNFEMACTDEMIKIALKVQPNAVCFVPEKREELTTEGGLDVVKNALKLYQEIIKLKSQKIRISLFVDPDLEQIKKAQEVGADIIEIHTGKFCDLKDKELQKKEFKKIKQAAQYGDEIGLECHVGHGLNYETTQKIVQIAEIKEINIGHFMISDAIFIGLEGVIKKMKKIINHSK